MKNYDLLQDRNLDENCSNGVWDLSHELMCELLEKMEIEKGTSFSDEVWEWIYNFLQEFKEAVLKQSKGESV